MKEFPYTGEGYDKAKAYLIRKGKWIEASTRGFSTDGWSIIQFANFVLEKDLSELNNGDKDQ